MKIFKLNDNKIAIVENILNQKNHLKIYRIDEKNNNFEIILEADVLNRHLDICYVFMENKEIKYMYFAYDIFIKKYILVKNALEIIIKNDKEYNFTYIGNNCVCSHDEKKIYLYYPDKIYGNYHKKCIVRIKKQFGHISQIKLMNNGKIYCLYGIYSKHLSSLHYVNILDIDFGCIVKNNLETFILEHELQNSIKINKENEFITHIDYIKNILICVLDYKIIHFYDIKESKLMYIYENPFVRNISNCFTILDKYIITLNSENKISNVISIVDEKISKMNFYFDTTFYFDNN